jgi:hypothetical protein
MLNDPSTDERPSTTILKPALKRGPANGLAAAHQSFGEPPSVNLH